MKKRFILLPVTLASMCLCIPLTACGGDGEQAKDESGLYGTFTYQYTVGAKAGELTITHDINAVSGREKLYSSVFPMDSGREGNAISYNMDQRLKLNRDYTYKYDWTILLSNPGDWGGYVARVTASISGTFSYVPTLVDGKYSVLLDAPIDGTLSVIASSVSYDNGGLGRIHNNPDYVIDYAVVSTLPDYEYDKYVAARVVAVDKPQKSITDDIFFADLLDFITPYSTY